MAHQAATPTNSPCLPINPMPWTSVRTSFRQAPREKQHVVVRTAQRFLAECRVGDCPCRLDVMAIDNCPGQPPVVRLHKDAFSPQMRSEEHTSELQSPD